MQDAQLRSQQRIDVVESTGLSSIETLRGSTGPGNQDGPLPVVATNTATAAYAIVTLQSARDTIRATALARQLKMQNPDCMVIWYAPADFSHLLDNNPYIDEIVALEGTLPEQERRIPTFRLSRKWKKFIIVGPRTSISLSDQSTVVKVSQHDDTSAEMLRPVLQLSDSEVREAREFMKTLPSGPRILLEIKDVDSTSTWEDDHYKILIDSVKHLNPVVVLLSKQQPKDFDILQEHYGNVVWFDGSMRLTAELYNHSNAYVGVSGTYSLIMQSDWCRNNLPTIEVTGAVDLNTLEYRHQDARKICVDVSKYRTSIGWLTSHLAGDPSAEFTADRTFSDVYITRRDGKFEYVSPAVISVKDDKLESVDVLERILSERGQFVFLYGGLGDSLLALSAPLDGNEPVNVVACANSIPATQSLLSAFGRVDRVLFIPKPEEHLIMTTIRFICTSHPMFIKSGTTPTGREESAWDSDSDLSSCEGVTMYPAWVQEIQGKKLCTPQVVLAPKGSVHGTFRSKRNIINPRFWPALLDCLESWGITPIIIGTPDEEEYYPAREFCINKRSYNLTEQMALMRAADCVIGADSWHKTFAAMAGKPTVVFESTLGHDMDNYVDASNFVFITPWKEIRFVRQFDEAMKAVGSILEKDMNDVQNIISAVREPLRVGLELPLRLNDKVFNSYNYNSARNILIRTDDDLRNTILVTNTVHRLKTLYPHLHITVSATEEGVELLRYNSDIDAWVLRGSSQEYRLESVADELIEYTTIIDLIAERYVGTHLMDVISGIAGISTTDRNIYYHVSSDEKVRAEESIAKKFGNQRNLRIGFHGMVKNDNRRSYNHGKVLFELIHSVNQDIQLINFGRSAYEPLPDYVLDCKLEEMPLRDQIALVEQCDIMITSDSEFLYAASNMFQKPTIFLIGAGDERCSGDESATNRVVVRNSENCKSCFGTCRTHCLGTVHPAKIIEEIVRFLNPNHKG